MSHHKRGKRKNARSGCLMCKFHKANGVKGTHTAQTFQEQRARLSEREQRLQMSAHSALDRQR